MPFPRRCLPRIAAVAAARETIVLILRYLGLCIWDTGLKRWGALVEGRCLKEAEEEEEEEEVPPPVSALFTPGMPIQGMLLRGARRALIGATT